MPVQLSSQFLPTSGYPNNNLAMQPYGAPTAPPVSQRGGPSYPVPPVGIPSSGSVSGGGLTMAGGDQTQYIGPPAQGQQAPPRPQRPPSHGPNGNAWGWRRRQGLGGNQPRQRPGQGTGAAPADWLARDKAFGESVYGTGASEAEKAAQIKAYFDQGVGRFDQSQGGQRPGQNYANMMIPGSQADPSGLGGQYQGAANAYHGRGIDPQVLQGLLERRMAERGFGRNGWTSQEGPRFDGGGMQGPPPSGGFYGAPSGFQGQVSGGFQSPSGMNQQQINAMMAYNQNTLNPSGDPYWTAFGGSQSQPQFQGEQQQPYDLYDMLGNWG